MPAPYQPRPIGGTVQPQPQQMPQMAPGAPSPWAPPAQYGPSAHAWGTFSDPRSAAAARAQNMHNAPGPGMFSQMGPGIGTPSQVPMVRDMTPLWQPFGAPPPMSAPTFQRGPGSAPAGVGVLSPQTQQRSITAQAGAGLNPSNGSSGSPPEDHISAMTDARGAPVAPYTLEAGGQYGQEVPWDYLRRRMGMRVQNGLKPMTFDDGTQGYYDPTTHTTYYTEGGKWYIGRDQKGYSKEGQAYVGYDGRGGDPASLQAGYRFTNDIGLTWEYDGKGGWSQVQPGDKGKYVDPNKQALDDAFARQRSLEEQRRAWIESNYRPEQLDQGVVDRNISAMRAQNAVAASRSARAQMSAAQHAGVDSSLALMGPMEAFQNDSIQSNSQAAQMQMQAEMVNLQQRSNMTNQKLAALNALMSDASSSEVKQWAAEEAQRTHQLGQYLAIQQQEAERAFQAQQAARQQTMGIAGAIGAGIGSLLGPIGSGIGSAIGGLAGGAAAGPAPAPPGYHQAYPGTYYSSW